MFLPLASCETVDMAFSFFEPVPFSSTVTSSHFTYVLLSSQQCRKRTPGPSLLSAPWFPALAFPPLEGTLVAQGSRESWQALTDATDMVAGPVAVHAERTRLGAAIAVEPWWAD